MRSLCGARSLLRMPYCKEIIARLSLTSRQGLCSQGFNTAGRLVLSRSEEKIPRVASCWIKVSSNVLGTVIMDSLVEERLTAATKHCFPLLVYRPRLRQWHCPRSSRRELPRASQREDTRLIHQKDQARWWGKYRKIFLSK